MSREFYLFDLMTGMIGQKIELTDFAWEKSCADSTLTTAHASGIGTGEATSVGIPWDQINGRTPKARARVITPLKRGIVMCERNASTRMEVPGTAHIAGALGSPSSTRDGLTIPFVSVMSLLEGRYLVHEGRYGTGRNHTSPGTWQWRNLSWRALACEVIKACTSLKPAGALPIDLPYLGETGTHQLPDVGGDEADEPTKSDTTTKHKTDLPDGWVETVTNGDTVTVTEHREKVTTKVIDTTEKYTVRKKDKHGKWVREERTRPAKKPIKTGRTVTETKTVTKPKGEGMVEKTVTRTTTTYQYDGAGKETGSQKHVDGPTVTVERRQVTTTYRDFNVANHSCADILRAISESEGGPDMLFRPYITADGRYVRWRFEAGSDADPGLPTDRHVSLSNYPHAGSTLEHMQIDRAYPIQRVYGVGAGKGSATLTCMAQDLTLAMSEDPMPLQEAVYSDSGAEAIGVLRSGTEGELSSRKQPIMQIRGRLHLDSVHTMDEMWPGTPVSLYVEGWPDLDTGIYECRLMKITGTQSDDVDVVFDVMADPTMT